MKLSINNFKNKQLVAIKEAIDGLIFGCLDKDLLVTKYESTDAI